MYQPLSNIPIYSNMINYKKDDKKIIITFMTTYIDFCKSLKRYNNYTEVELEQLWEEFKKDFKCHPSLRKLSISILQIKNCLPEYIINSIKIGDIKVDININVNVICEI